MIAFLGGHFRQKPLAYWRQWFTDMDVSFAPVNTPREALDDANVRARAMIIEDDLGREHIAPVVRFLQEPATVGLREPMLGEHNEEILRDLCGLTDHDLARLASAGVIGTRPKGL